MISKENLMSIQSENWHNNGAHGEVDPAVMADIGYTPFDQFDNVVVQARLRASVQQPSVARHPTRGSRTTPPVIRGESEGEFGVSYHHEYEPLPSERVDIGKIGLQGLREALKPKDDEE